jgi:class 3 adenylate cyclase
MPSPALPAGTVTILFTNIEGSTRLLQRLDDYRYAQGTRVLHSTTEVGGLRAVDQ